MATIKLGLLGDEYTIPNVTVSLPVSIVKQISRVVMSDGSRRFGYYDSFRRWKVECTKLTKAQLDEIIDEYNRSQELRFQNTHESATWYYVVMLDFDYDSVDPLLTTELYWARFTLEETELV